MIHGDFLKKISIHKKKNQPPRKNLNVPKKNLNTRKDVDSHNKTQAPSKKNPWKNLAPLLEKIFSPEKPQSP